LVVKVNVKESIEGGPMVASTELLEAWVSSDMADSVSDKANGGYPGKVAGKCNPDHRVNHPDVLCDGE
jgi:hypothetical protein